MDAPQVWKPAIQQTWKSAVQFALLVLAFLAVPQLQAAPTITSLTPSQTVLAGGNVTNTVTASGANPITYQWVLNGSNLTAATNPSLIITNASAANAGNYQVIVANASGSVTSTVVTLNVEYAPNYGWFKTYGTPGDERVVSMTYDAVGNLIVAGTYNNTLVLGTNVFISAGGQDLFLAKYDRTGNLLWARSAGSSGTDNWGIQLAVDNAGNIYSPGNFSGTISFGASSLTAVGGQDCFLVKYDANGNFQWARRGGSSATDYGGGVAVDSTGAVLFTGYYDANVQFDGAPSVLNAGTADNMFLVKYDSNGNFLWQQSGTGSPYGQSVAVDSNNAAIVVGSMGNGGNFGGIQVASGNNGHANMFLAKFDSAGNAVWARSLASSGDALGRSLALDRQGSIFLGGTYLDNTTLGGFPLTCGGVEDGYVLKCDSSGNGLWAQTVGGPGDDGVNCVAVDPFGNVLVGGTIDNGGSGGGFSFSPNGRNAFLLKLDASGHGLWSRLVTSSPVGTFYSVAYSANGDLAAGGSFAGTASSGPFTMNNVGSQDGMVVAFTEQPLFATPLTGQGALAGGSVTFNANATGSNLVYQWFQNGSAVTNATNSTLTLNNLQLAQAGTQYTVVVTNYFGSITSAVAILSVELAPNHAWFKTYGTAGDDGVNAVAYDAAGNLIVAGQFNNTLVLGTNVLVSAGGPDLFLAKYDRAGNVIWARRAGGSGADNWGIQVAVDNAGNIYLPGNFNAAISFGAFTLPYSGGAQDCFLVKYDANGNPLWARRGASSATDYGGGVAVDSTGAVLFTGYYDANAQFDGAPSVLTAGTGDNLFVVKYAANGDFLWQQSGTGSPFGQSVAVDTNNSVVVVGAMGNSGNFGGIQAVGTSGHENLFLAKFDSAGNAVWAKSLTSAGDARGRTVALDRQGNIFLGGYYVNNTTLGGVPLTGTGASDGFVMKCDPSGTPLWVQGVSSSGSDDIDALAVDQFGNVLVGGSVAAGGTGGGFTFSPPGRNGFLLKLDATGHGLWSRLVTSSTPGVVGSVAFGLNGDLAAGAYFNGTGNSGPFIMNNAGGQDGLVLVLGEQPELTVPLASQSVLLGSNVIFNVGATGSGLGYQWYKSVISNQWTVISGATGSTLQLAGVSAADAANYQCVVTNYFGSVTSAVARLSVEYAPSFTWARNGGGAGQDRFYGVAADATGNQYAAGWFTGTAAFGNTNLVSAGGENICLVKYDRAGNVLWARRAGGTSDDWARGVTVDPAGNVIVVGSYQSGTATFGNTNLSVSGPRDGFVAKYDSAGNLLWVNRMGGSAWDDARAAVTDSAGNIYVTGDYQVAANFSSYNLPGYASEGVYVAKYGPSGNLLWVQGGGSSTAVDDEAECIALDPSGNVYIGGYFNATMAIAGLSLTSAGGDNTFLASYDANGNGRWVRRFGGAGAARIYGLAANSMGEIFAAGYFVGNVPFAGSTLANAGGADAMVLKYNNTGNEVWGLEFGGVGDDDGLALTADGSDGVILGMVFQGTITAGVGNTLSSAGGYDVALVKIGADSTVVWTRQLGGTANEDVWGIVASQAGEVAAVGDFNGQAPVGSLTLNSAGSLDAFIARLTTTPVFSTPLAGLGGLLGSNVTFNAAASGMGLSYQWYQNGVALTNATNSSLAFTNLQLAQAGNNYAVVVTNYFGAVTSAVSTLTLEDEPAFVRVQGSTVNGTAYESAVDTNGNLYVVGEFTGIATFGTTNLSTSAARDAFVAKFDANGNVLWVRQGGGTGYNGAYRVALDGSGNVLVSGYFDTSAAFGAAHVTAVGGRDMFVAKYDGSGNLLWIRTGGSSGNDYAHGLGVDAAGNVYATGFIEGNATFSGSALTCSGARDIYLVKYDSAGNLLWLKRAGGTGADGAVRLAVDAAGNSHLTGFFTADASFDNITLHYSGGTGNDAFVAKYDPAGNVLWATGFGGTSDEFAEAIGVDNSGNVYAAGIFNGSFTVAGTTLTTAGDYDVYLLKLDHNGNILWARRGGSSGTDVPNGLSVTPQGNILVTGQLGGTGNFGTWTVPGSASPDLFLAEWDPSGNVVWALSGGGSGNDYGAGVSSDAAGNVYVTGVQTPPAAFGVLTVGSGLAGNDILIAKLTRGPGVTVPLVSQTVVLGTNVTFNAGVVGMGLSYQWYQNGVPLTNATNSTLTLNNVQSAQSGNQYTVVATNAYGSVTSSVAQLAVLNCPPSSAAYNFTTLAGLAGTAGSVDGTNGTARLDFPYGMSVDGAGNIYVADKTQHVIRKLTPAGVATTLAGMPGVAGAVDGVGSSARFSSPLSAAADYWGNVYVADSGGCTIRKVKPDGTVSTIAGSAGNRGTADGLGSAARFGGVYGICVDGQGNVYASDPDYSTIRKIAPDGTVITLAGLANYSGTADGQGSTARFWSPLGVAVDPVGNVYVADGAMQTIRKITPSGLVSTLAGLGNNLGYADGTGTAARFSGPAGMAVDDFGNVFVSEFGNHTIRMITPSGTVTTVGGLAGSTGSSDGSGSAARFNQPCGVAIGCGSQFYVSDSANHTIRLGSPLPPPILTQPTSITNFVQADSTLSVSAGGGGLGYQWQLNGTNILGANGASLTLTNVTLGNAGTYRAIVTNAFGAVTSAVATLTVKIPNPGDQLWQVTVAGAGAAVGQGIALGTNGWIYFVGASGNVQALDRRTGVLMWTFNTGDNPSDAITPAIGPDGAVYVGSAVPKKLFKLNGQTGAKLWEFQAGAAFHATPALAEDGLLYAGNYDGKLYCLNSTNGQQLWSYATSGAIVSSPALGVNGMIYFGSYDYSVYALNRTNGGLVWKFATGSYLPRSPAIGADGTVYIPSLDNHIYALNGVTGGQRWVFAVGSYPSLSPAIGPDGSVFIGLTDGSLYSIDGLSGSAHLVRTASGTVTEGAAVGADGTLYFTANSLLYDINITNGALVWSYTAGGMAYPPLLAPDGKLYFGSADGNMHCLASASTNGLALSTWPMLNQNPQRTGGFMIPPVITAQPFSFTTVMQSNATLSVTAVGNRLGYQWQWNGVNVPGANGSSLAFTNVSMTNAGIYSVVVTNSFGTVTSALVQLNVETVPYFLRSLTNANGSALQYPVGVAVDRAGNIYVTDASTAQVIKYGPGGNYLLQWGGAGTGNGKFYLPYGLAVDANTNVFVVDNNHRIQKFNSSGTYQTQWGSTGTGNGQFRDMNCLALDTNGNVFVADTYNQRIQKFDNNGTYLTNWGIAGTGNGQFQYPQHRGGSEQQRLCGGRGK